MNEKARHICNDYTEKGCRPAGCPLAEACSPHVGDEVYGAFADRMDKAAELVEIEGWE